MSTDTRGTDTSDASVDRTSTRPTMGRSSTVRARRRRMRAKARWVNRAWAGASILAGLLVWEAVGALELVDPLFLPRLSSVTADLVGLFSTGEIFPHLWMSGQTYVAGLTMAIVVGITLGMLMGRIRIVERILSPWVHAMYAVPRVAFIPIFVVWFGIGMQAKVALVFVMAVFPILLSTQVGAATVDKTLTDMARGFHASGWFRFTTIVIPASVPNVLTGIRLGVANGLIGVVVAEFFGAVAGVGYLLTRATFMFNSVRIFAMVMILAITGVTLTSLTKRLEERVDRWRH